MEFDFSKFYDFGHYGIFNEEDALYPEVRELLKKALESGEDFDTGWGGFKKEIQSIRIRAVGNIITVSVGLSMDDMPDLIYDCENSEDLTDDEIDEIIDDWDFTDYTTDVYSDRELQRDSTVLDIMETAACACIECSLLLREGFQWVQSYVDYIRERR